jgi:hypothetical protein
VSRGCGGPEAATTEALAAQEVPTTEAPAAAAAFWWQIPAAAVEIPAAAATEALAAPETPTAQACRQWRVRCPAFDDAVMLPLAASFESMQQTLDDYRRRVSEQRPSVVVFENVPRVPRIRPFYQPRWWRGVVPPGLMQRIDMSPDIHWRVPDTGACDEATVLAHCERVIRPLSTGCFYIGISGEPDVRWSEGHSRTYSAMYIIAIARNSRVTSRIERDLIARFSGNFHCVNIGAGGERASAASPHFVYVVFRSDGLLRRSGGRPGRNGGLGNTSVAEDVEFWGRAWRS